MYFSPPCVIRSLRSYDCFTLISLLGYFVNRIFLNKLTFEQCFDSYFHNKYSFDDFIHTKPIISRNINKVKFSTYHFFSYTKNKNFLPEAKKLRDYHHFLNSIIFKNMNVCDNVYSYIQNKTSYGAISEHKNNKFFFKTDINSFFKNINYDLVLQCLKDNMNNYFAIVPNKLLKTIVDMTIIDDSLPIGFVTSPAISNAVLYDFDLKIVKYCNDNNITYTRYSDDLIFSSNNYELMKNIENIIKEYLLIINDKMTMNEKKSIHLSKSNTINILGLVIRPDSHITVKKHIKTRIKQLIYFYINNKEKYIEFLNIYYNGNHGTAYGTLNYINNIDKKFILYLRKKYGNFVIDKFLHGNKKNG